MDPDLAQSLTEKEYIISRNGGSRIPPCLDFQEKMEFLGWFEKNKPKMMDTRFSFAEHLKLLSEFRSRNDVV
jgi:hypothetical protein